MALLGTPRFAAACGELIDDGVGDAEVILRRFECRYWCPFVEVTAYPVWNPQAVPSHFLSA
jgi:hypothetical protein